MEGFVSSHGEQVVKSDKGYITTLPEDVLAAYEAPFPHQAYKAGVRKFPLIAPIPEDPGPANKLIRKIGDKVQNFDKPVQTLFAKGDPIIPSGRIRFPELFSSSEEYVIKGSGHFLQENAGERVAECIVRFIKETPV